jgi:endo-1,4-beta-xylanase
VPAAAAEQGTLHDLAAAHGKYFGSATDNPELPDAAYAATLGSEFGQITPGNSMKWDTTEPQQGQFSFTKGDVITDFARDHGQTVRGHTLVWHSQLPGWVASLPSTQVEAAMTNHITEVAGHYRGDVAAWDGSRCRSCVAATGAAAQCARDGLQFVCGRPSTASWVCFRAMG